MDILIKGMEMPQQMESPITITIFKNGSVWMNDVTFGKGKLPNAKAVALPEHGRLCDLDSFIEHETYNIEQALFDSDEVLEDLKNAPVIVEASNGN